MSEPRTSRLRREALQPSHPSHLPNPILKVVKASGRERIRTCRRRFPFQDIGACIRGCAAYFAKQSGWTGAGGGWRGWRSPETGGAATSGTKLRLPPLPPPARPSAPLPCRDGGMLCQRSLTSRSPRFFDTPRLDATTPHPSLLPLAPLSHGPDPLEVSPSPVAPARLVAFPDIAYPQFRTDASHMVAPGLFGLLASAAPKGRGGLAYYFLRRAQSSQDARRFLQIFRSLPRGRCLTPSQEIFSVRHFFYCKASKAT
jgi:hypothetical protein